MMYFKIKFYGILCDKFIDDGHIREVFLENWKEAEEWAKRHIKFYNNMFEGYEIEGYNIIFEDTTTHYSERLKKLLAENR